MKRVMFFILALALGLTLAFRGLIAFSDYLGALSAGETATKPASPTVATASPSPTAIPDPTAQELDRLVNGPPEDQIAAIRTMAGRRPTPELREAVEQTLFRSQHPDVLGEATCLKVKAFPEDALAYALSTLPADKKTYGWNVGTRNMCLLRAVAAHAAEDPVRARELLLLGACSDNGTVRDVVRSGFERIELPDMPPTLQLAAQSSWGHERRCAISAAIALGALERAPMMVERALFDREGGGEVVRHHLLRSESPAAPRLLARMLAREGEREPLAKVALERERTRHDVTPALLELAYDEGQGGEVRAAALELIGRHGDVGAIPRLSALRNRPDPVLQPRAIAATMALETRRDAGATPSMATLER